MFTMSIRWQWRTDNPCRGVERNQEHKRRRYLSADELARLTVALARHPDQQSANIIRLLLLTGARRGEVLAARWVDFNAGFDIWVKPGATTKQKTEHQVPLNAPARQLLLELRSQVPSFAVEPIIAPVRDTFTLESVIAAQALAPNGGLIVIPDSFTDVHRAEIISLAARFGLPAIYPRRPFTELGGLLSYGIDQVDSYRRAAAYVDRILKGEKPSELPVQAPVKFELVINLKTAKSLGLNIPVALQQRADELIE
jgi:ABC transporter substrate binding protein/Phage integrase family